MLALTSCSRLRCLLLRHQWHTWPSLTVGYPLGAGRDTALTAALPTEAGTEADDEVPTLVYDSEDLALPEVTSCQGHAQVVIAWLSGSE